MFKMLSLVSRSRTEIFRKEGLDKVQEKENLQKENLENTLNSQIDLQAQEILYSVSELESLGLDIYDISDLLQNAVGLCHNLKTLDVESVPLNHKLTISQTGNIGE